MNDSPAIVLHAKYAMLFIQSTEIVIFTQHPNNKSVIKIYHKNTNAQVFVPTHKYDTFTHSHKPKIIIRPRKNGG